MNQNGATARDRGRRPSCRGIFILVAPLSPLAATRVVERQRIALRAAGCWICAVGVLMAGWALRQASER